MLYLRNNNKLLLVTIIINLQDFSTTSLQFPKSRTEQKKLQGSFGAVKSFNRSNISWSQS